MENNFKYLTHNSEDKKWGLYLMVAGSARIEPDTSYPPKGHPTGYNFEWKNGTRHAASGLAQGTVFRDRSCRSLKINQ